LAQVAAESDVPMEDLANTPAERAAAVAAAASKPSQPDEAQRFAEAKEVVVGEGGGHIIVVGAGLVGSLCSIVLARKGFKVHLYERYADIRTIPGAGRSINLSVTSRGLRAIRNCDQALYNDVLKLAVPVYGRIIHLADGKTLFQRYGKDDTEFNYAISRVELNKFLISMAAQEGAEIHFNHHLSDTSDFTGGELVGCRLNFVQQQKGETDVHTYLRVRALCPVIACDGGGSRVRYALRRAGLTTFTEDMLTRGYKEVLFPNPGEGNDFGAKPENGGEACPGFHGLHIWPRGDHMLMALPNLDGSFTGTVYMDMKGSDCSFEAFGNSPEGRAKCKAFSERHYNDAAPHVGGMESLVDQITTNPTGILGTVRTEQWAIKGKVVLIGDACHAMVPFFGQGCNCGFEDTLWLSKLLDKYCCEDGRCNPSKCTGESFQSCFAELERERKPNADAICDMALENFVEMRDRTGDPKFLAMKKVENALENAYPAKFRSRYAMVCYGGEGNVSYANARKLGLVQASILDCLCTSAGGGKTNGDEDAIDVDLNKAERLIDQELVPCQRELGVDLSTVKH